MAVPNGNEDRVQFWDDKWLRNATAWHKSDVNEFLERHYAKLTNGKGKLRFFVPLCGKSVDMKWLYDHGHNIVGVEAVEKPILEFFSEQQLPYEVTKEEGYTLFKTNDDRIHIYRSDLFALPLDKLGKFDAIWDRGSLVAIYLEDREEYSRLLKNISSDGAKYLVAVMHYDSSKFPGPPRNVSKEELEKLFGDTFEIEEVDRIDRSKIPMGIERTLVEDSWECIYLLTRK